MFRKILKSKIHRARITGADIEYQGSITIDKNLIELADLKPFEFVDIWDISNGARFETYVIEGKEGSGEICINGAAARLVAKNDLVIIASHSYIDDASQIPEPKLVFVDSDNKPV
ncbi:MAG TPA: aspartate 1-decarboxylase [bacterium]|jgi:aspartate 1-decarboxylase|nr:aspartate 1-decarboxylase [bacterium]MDX9805729.1 aspartate 1-decarboxylase [bacterium]HNZ54938.1 aspartate 1-decarboxylase [bacterium]HOB70247.1 aspartate 1-decarboxylase [bacterium]HOG43372.1 aspartate 1-decarboxylase [bacterium]